MRREKPRSSIIHFANRRRTSSESSSSSSSSSSLASTSSPNPQDFSLPLLVTLYTYRVLYIKREAEAAFGASDGLTSTRRRGETTRRDDDAERERDILAVKQYSDSKAGSCCLRRAYAPEARSGNAKHTNRAEERERARALVLAARN